jgi:hypothetical protein
MKKRNLIPGIIAIIVVLSAPFSHLPMSDSDPHGGLICYCCSALGEKCSMISCSGCGGCGAKTGDVDRWSPELLPHSFHALSHLRFVYRGMESCRSPESVCLDVLDKPPNRV